MTAHREGSGLYTDPLGGASSSSEDAAELRRLVREEFCLAFRLLRRVWRWLRGEAPDWAPELASPLEGGSSLSLDPIGSRSAEKGSEAAVGRFCKLEASVEESLEDGSGSASRAANRSPCQRSARIAGGYLSKSGRWISFSNIRACQDRRILWWSRSQKSQHELSRAYPTSMHR